MHAIFGLVEHDRALGLENLIGDLELLDAELLGDGGADRRLGVVIGRQAVHEDSIVGSHAHNLGGHAIGLQKLDALAPNLVGLAHGNPDVGVNRVGTGHALGHVLGKQNLGAVFGGDGATGIDQSLLRHLLLRAASAEVHAELGASDHERIGHVVLGVAHEGELQTSQGAELLAQGEHVGDHLSGMELGGKAVPHGNAGVSGKLLNDFLPVTAVLDAVEHASKHASGVPDGLLLAHLRRTRIKVNHAHAQVAPGNLEGAARARGSFLK